jgi:hypothetical protein
MSLAALPSTFGATRESLRAVACFVLGPAARARTGHIWLQPRDDGFGTPAGNGLPSLVVVGDALVRGDGASCPVTSLRIAAGLAGVELEADPGVGAGIPELRPDAALVIDDVSSRLLGGWFVFGATVLHSLRVRLGTRASVGPACLWPEHFDLALTVDAGPGRQANVGVSPGDDYSDDPYVYVGPWDTGTLQGPLWNAPFGAALTRQRLAGRRDDALDPERVVARFVDTALAALLIA